jgi:micrococcal nuclease
MVHRCPLQWPEILRLSTLIALLLLALPAYADVTGRVVGVHDGDTVTLLTADKHQVKVRAADIDAPELGQPFGTAARSAMSDLVYAKQVAVTGEHPDRYGRTVGRIVVFEPGSTVVANVEMVRRGMAWVYVRYNENPSLPAIEAEARAAHRGLWRDTNPVPPWDWRRKH